MAEKADYVEPGVTCADVCEVLGQGIDGKRANQLSHHFKYVNFQVPERGLHENDFCDLARDIAGDLVCVFDGLANFPC